ncbi:DUF2480 family protein [Paenimyroides aestuarii]|uniref:DUF2480 family protein n=1 Tax=Paenimyroides aestuarii TaxID=2968490 RepID=A0ABY5NUL4_9FLAO|nr:DUF2480 family protein [Paenimyroides aestuarii]UUV22254.1 DUF2480 family protein [Paenimyroides aestuarii]
MEEEIINKVAQSSLVVFDLEDYFPAEEAVVVDISQWLYEGFVLKEKEFRAALKEVDFTVYQNKLVALTCSTDAILPSWAFMLVSSYLQPFAKQVNQGSLTDLYLAFYQNLINTIDFSVYQDQPVIIKGCSKKAIPEEAYVMATQKMMHHARSIMFGEACSAVPIYKRKKIEN